MKVVWNGRVGTTAALLMEATGRPLRFYGISIGRFAIGLLVVRRGVA